MACNSEDNNIEKENSNSISHEGTQISSIKTDEIESTSQNSNRTNENVLEDFKNDRIVIVLRENYYQFLSYVQDKNVDGVSLTITQGKIHLNQLYEKYGKANTLLYFEELGDGEQNSATDPNVLKILVGSQDGSSCTRNLNGTTYWGNCSFWEGANAYVHILANCGHVSGSDSQQYIEEYYDCNQAQICKYC